MLESQNSVLRDVNDRLSIDSKTTIAECDDAADTKSDRSGEVLVQNQESGSHRQLKTFSDDTGPPILSYTMSPPAAKTPEVLVASVGPPPDGGLVAWSQVLGAFLIVFNCWGLINSFGLFQTYYKTTYPSASPSSISWISSIQIFLLMFVGAYSGSASDSGYFRLMTIAGAVLFVFGVFMASICNEFWQLVLAHGICTGLGNGLVFTPTMSVAATYFSPKRKSLAIGITLCGAGVGGVVLPFLFDRLLSCVGFGWTLRIFGFIALTLFAVAQALMKKRLPPKDGTRILGFDSLKDVKFVLFIIGAFMNFLGLYFAFFYVGAYARDILGLSFSQSVNMLLIINGLGIPGRLVLLWLADQRQWKGFRPITVTLPVNLATSILLFGWIGVHNRGGLIAFAAFYGFVGNGLQCLFNATLADMALDPRRTGVYMGWGFTIDSFSVLIGNPIGGFLVQADKGQYLYAQLYAGICTMCGCVIIAVAAWLRTRQEKKFDGNGQMNEQRAAGTK